MGMTSSLQRRIEGLRRRRGAMLAGLAAGMLAAATPAPGAAQSAKWGDAGNGGQLARTLCASCHQVAPSDSGPINADVPTFASIASRPGISAEQIAGAIVMPHPPMPRLSLTRNDIADLSSYIMSLKGNATD